MGSDEHAQERALRELQRRQAATGGRRGEERRQLRLRGHRARPAHDGKVRQQREAEHLGPPGAGFDDPEADLPEQDDQDEVVENLARCRELLPTSGVAVSDFHFRCRECVPMSGGTSASGMDFEPYDSTAELESAVGIEPQSSDPILTESWRRS